MLDSVQAVATSPPPPHRMGMGLGARCAANPRWWRPLIVLTSFRRAGPSQEHGAGRLSIGQASILATTTSCLWLCETLPMEARPIRLPMLTKPSRGGQLHRHPGGQDPTSLDCLCRPALLASVVETWDAEHARTAVAKWRYSCSLGNRSLLLRGNNLCLAIVWPRDGLSQRGMASLSTSKPTPILRNDDTKRHSRSAAHLLPVQSRPFNHQHGPVWQWHLCFELCHPPHCAQSVLQLIGGIMSSCLVSPPRPSSLILHLDGIPHY